MNAEILAVEQEVIDLEQRYWGVLRNLQPKVPRWDSNTRTFRRAEFAVLGTLDGVPIIETYQHGLGYRGETELVPNCSYGGRDYSLLTGVTAGNARTLMRTTRLQGEGLDHIFGVVEGDHLYGDTLGIYVPSDVLEPMRNRHVEEIIKDYPCVSVNIDQIRGLNISPDFVYRIQSEIGLTMIDENNPPIHAVRVKPVADGRDYTGEEITGEPRDVTQFYIEKLAAPRINLIDFVNKGKRDDLLERVRQAIGAVAYQWHSGYGEGEGLNDFMFRFNRVLSNQEIAQALQNLGKPEDQTYQVTLYRLNDKSRGLVNLPLGNAVRSPDQNIQNLEKLINVSSARFVLGVY